MLNISENSITKKVNIKELKSFNQNQLPKSTTLFAWWLIALLIFIIILFFMPWTQNIQMKGKVTTLLPEQRPQKVNSTIDGKIEKWFVREGDLVDKGDTIVFLSEIKPEYLDKQLIGKTQNQIDAKEQAIKSYDSKASALDKQIVAMRQELSFKKEQLKNKIEQTRLKQQSLQAEVQQAENDYEIATFQYKRTDSLYRQGIKSLNDLENKRLKMQSTNAKLITQKNKLNEISNEININTLSYETLDNEYNSKIAKVESDKFSTLSTKYDAEGSLNKLENTVENYKQRNDMYYILAPQAGFITKTVKSGIGEIIKATEDIVSIVPSERELAIELYMKPMDLPLIDLEQKVSLVFDGWQAFIISGWSNFSVGTYSGKVVAIDNVPNEKSEYRILVKADNREENPFPELLRVGAGVKGIALLKTVPVWYELWRQLNGFPADFYENDIQKEEKFKPPVKSVAK